MREAWRDAVIGMLIFTYPLTFWFMVWLAGGLVLCLKIAVVLITTMVIFWQIDERYYPLCPRCGDNLHTRRPSFFTGYAVCRSHPKIIIL